MVPEDISDRLITNLIITIMKKILTVIALLMLVGTMQAQRQVTTFLGIPVDGTKAEMKRKLVAKGFTPKGYGDNEYLEGEFNGRDVLLGIVTNNNKVYRIAVADANSVDEANIRIRYNTLIQQFEANGKYETVHAIPIDEDTDISYEMTVNNKIFEAVFIQKSRALTTDKNATDKTSSAVGTESTEQQAQDKFKRLVWFRIMENFGKYGITIFYDNGYNEANGEDL